MSSIVIPFQANKTKRYIYPPLIWRTFCKSMVKISAVADFIMTFTIIQGKKKIQTYFEFYMLSGYGLNYCGGNPTI